MATIREGLSASETMALEQMRGWALNQGSASERLIGQLAIAQRLLDAVGYGAQDRWKVNAIAVLLGDALVKAQQGRLHWVVAEDEQGLTYALNWRHTSVLIYPMHVLNTLVSEANAVDVHSLYTEMNALCLQLSA